MKKDCLKKARIIFGVLFLMCIMCLMLGACNKDVQPDVHTHALGVYQYDSTYHWRICGSCGEIQNKAAHSFDSWSIVTEATATSEGVKSHTCSICGYEETSSIPKIQCTNHQYGEWIVTKQPTETQDGIKQRTCNICGHVETADVPMTGQPTYQINFNLNGGTSPSYVASKYVTELNKADFFFNVQKDGLNFRGWSYNGVKVFDESGNLVKSVELKPSMTFVALWANQAKLTIVTNMPEAGDISKGREYEYNTEVDVYAHPYQGYEFLGWFYEDSVLSQQEEYNYKMWDKDVTIIAKFQLASFKLSLIVNNSDKGLVIINPTGTIADLYEARKENLIQYTREITISAYTKTETRFLGWFDEDGILVTTNAVYTFDMPNHDCALTARWNYFTVNYNLNGGTNNTQNPTSYDTDMANVKLYNPTKAGVIFIGWQYNGQTITEINTKLGENLTLEAIWSEGSYKITYDYDGGSVSNDSTYAVSSGYTLKNPTKPGCTFLGWTGSNGTTPQINVIIPAGTIGDKTYKANWRIVVYNITYSLSGGKNNTNNPSTYTVNDGSIALHNPTRDYYTFKSWRYNGNTVTSISSSWLKDVTIEAVWEPISYSISYNLNGGSATNNTTYTVENGGFTLNNPTKTGYMFLGWTGSNGTAPSKNVRVTTNVPTNLSYTANWEINTYTVTYQLGGGTTSQDNPTSYTVQSDNIILRNPTRENYNFIGWYYQGKKITKIQTSLAANMEIVAKWEAKKYTISYELSGGINAATNPSTYTVESGTITFANPIKNGYNFTGWDIPKIPSGSVGDIIVTASWSEPVVYTITYDLAGGKLENNPNPATYTVKTPTFTITGTPTRELEENLVFTGWSSTTIQEGSFGNITITAQYEEIFTVSGNTITGVNTVAKEMTSIQIPGNIHGAVVASIGQNAFRNCTSLTSITIPNSVTSIGGSAFYGCSGLENIVVESGNTVYHSDGNCLIETASKTLIAGCKNSIIPTNGSVTSIGEYAFEYCTGLTSVTIPDSVTSIGGSAFSGCSGLTSVTIGNGVTSISYNAFYNCSLYRVINHSNLVLTIGSSNNGYVAYYAKLLIDKEGNTTYNKNDGYTYLVTEDEFLFRKQGSAYTLIAYFGGKETVTLPAEINSNTYSIYQMRSVRNVILPNNMTSIGNKAFYGCKGLTSVTIPDSVTSIGNYAFSGCTGLTNITIPNSVTSIGNYAFSGCPGLTSVTIPDSVTSIGSYAFYRCTGLTSVTIGNNVTSIGWLAFYRCTGLESIVVESGNTVYHSDGNCLIETASKTLIVGCNTSVIPTDGSVTSIGYGAFSGCSGLTSVTIPDSVTSIGEDAFYYCTNLTEIHFHGTEQEWNAIEKGSGWDTDTGNYTVIFRQGYSEGLAFTSNGDGTCFVSGISTCTDTELRIPPVSPDGDRVTSIGYEAFRYCTSLTSVTIPNSVTSIGNYAFYYCTGLESITIPDSVTSIGASAFSGCTGLTSVTFSNTSGWYVTKTQGASRGRNMTVTDPSTNATNLKSDYYNYYWYRK